MSNVIDIVSLFDTEAAKPGEALGTSEWLAVTQHRINQFAEATGDFQFIHVDPERASREGPFGGTVAHGFLTLSLVSAMASKMVCQPDAIESIVIASIDSVKFLAPVRVNQRVRGVFTLRRSLRLGERQRLFKVNVKVEVADDAKMALNCELSWVVKLKIGYEEAQAS